MDEISETQCIELMKKTFPKFLPYWEDYVKKNGIDDGIIVKMIPFGDYTIDVIQSNKSSEIKNIFDFVEFLACHGNESVQNAITTGFLEYLMHQDSDVIQFTTFAKYLGKESIEYCRAWDKFTGVRTKGLWEE